MARRRLRRKLAHSTSAKSALPGGNILKTLIVTIVSA